MELKEIFEEIEDKYEKNIYLSQEKISRYIFLLKNQEKKSKKPQNSYYINLSLGYLYLFKKEYNLSKKYLKSILKIFPKSYVNKIPNVLLMLSLLYYYNHNYNKYIRYSYQSLILSIILKNKIVMEGKNVLAVKDNKEIKEIFNKLSYLDKSFQEYQKIIDIILPFYPEEDIKFNNRYQIINYFSIKRISQLEQIKTNYLLAPIFSHNIFHNLIREGLNKLLLFTCTYQVYHFQKSIYDFYLKLYSDNNVISRHIINSKQNTEQNTTQNIQTNKIKIGFVGKDFRFYEGLINNISREKFDVKIFSIQYKKYENISIKEKNENLILENLNLIELLNKDEYIRLYDNVLENQKTIIDNNLDILIFTDLKNTNVYLLTLGKLAPIQIVSWENLFTTGIKTIDYFISSSLFGNYFEKNNYFYENLIEFSTLGIYKKYDENLFKLKNTEKIKYREKYLLPKTKNIYLVPFKIKYLNKTMFEIFKKILDKDNNSLLLLLSPKKIELKRSYYKIMEEIFQDKINNIQFLEPLKSQNNSKQNRKKHFLELVCASDVILDIENTQFEVIFNVLSVGKCIITLPNNSLRSRITFGIYKKMGILDLIAQNEKDFVEKAFLIADTTDIRNEMENKICQKRNLILEDNKELIEWENMLLNIYNNKNK